MIIEQMLAKHPQAAGPDLDAVACCVEACHDCAPACTRCADADRVFHDRVHEPDHNELAERPATTVAPVCGACSYPSKRIPAPSPNRVLRHRKP